METETIQDETLQSEESEVVEALKKEITSLKEELINVKTKALRNYEQSKELPPDIATEMARFNMDMKKAEILSKAMPVKNPADVLVRIMTGREMGMDPMEAVQSLYNVNGITSLHSKGLPAFFQKRGYTIEYLDETYDGVTVRMTKGSWVREYKVKRNEEILKKSKAMAFASKNKMRFHGIRQIANFHLAHLLGPVNIWDEDDMESAEKRSGNYIEEAVVVPDKKDEIIDNLKKKIETIPQLVEYWNLLDKAEQNDENISRAFSIKKTEILQGS